MSNSYLIKCNHKCGLKKYLNMQFVLPTKNVVAYFIATYQKQIRQFYDFRVILYNNLKWKTMISDDTIIIE
jgi:hypothetical protein